jgi:hypothetical protein
LNVLLIGTNLLLLPTPLQKVRITEANSLSGAGEEGTSDAYAAALWTVDISFEFAAVGIQSLHFHFGHGGLPGNSVEAGVPVYSGVFDSLSVVINCSAVLGLSVDDSSYDSSVEPLLDRASLPLTQCTLSIYCSNLPSICP